jgi:hypothetical protein
MLKLNHNQYMKTKFLRWVGVLYIGLTGCYDITNFDNIVVDPFTTSYVFPVLNDSITINDILHNADSIKKYLQENTDRSYSILYRKTIDLDSGVTQFTIPNQTFSYSFDIPEIPTGIPLPADQIFPFDTISENSITTTTDAGATIELKGIDFSSGTITIHAVNNFHHAVNGIMTFSSLVNSQNKALVVHFDLNSYGATKDSTINLVDYHLDAYYPKLDAYNYFFYRIQGTLKTFNAQVNAGDNISIQVSATSPVFSRITGKINYSFVKDNQTVNVDFMPKDLNLNIQEHFVDPKISLKFINNFGIPISATFTQFRINNKQNLPVNLTSSRSQVGDLQIPNIANLIPPIVRLDQTDTTITYKLNKDNSNIPLAFDNIPTSIDFGGKFDLGDASANHDYFISTTSRIKLEAEAEIPIYGWVSISMTDTLDMIKMDLPRLDSIKDIDITTADIKLVLKILNSIPFEVALQVDFINENTLETTKLFDNTVEEPLVLSPNVGVDGTSNETVSKTTSINIDREKYDKISQSTKAIIRFRFELGKSGQDAKVLSTDKLRIKANFYLSGTVKPKL